MPYHHALKLRAAVFGHNRRMILDGLVQRLEDEAIVARSTRHVGTKVKPLATDLQAEVDPHG